MPDERDQANLAAAAGGARGRPRQRPLPRGRAAAPRDGDGLEAAVGPEPRAGLAVGVPPPGERVGSSWWQAIVPIAPVRDAFEAAVSLSVRTESETTRLELGRVRLEPGSSPAAAAGPGELVAICMATHEPPPALLRAQIDSIRSQTHRDWVCVISDDASSDAARAEIERAIAGDARFSSSPTRSGSASTATSSALCERFRPRRVTSRSAIRTTAGTPTSWLPCYPRSGRTTCSSTATPGSWTPTAA